MPALLLSDTGNRDNLQLNSAMDMAALKFKVAGIGSEVPWSKRCINY
jgi:hypothetical protein